jgi:cytochrome c oxidase subunit 2
MRMLGLTSIVLAAGLALSGPAQAQHAAPAPAPVTLAPTLAPEAAAVTNDAAPANAAAPAVADPLLNPDGTPRTAPVAGVGLPVDGHIGMQEQVTPTGKELHWFHDIILVPLITIISLFVLALLLWVIVRYRRAANPVPSKTAHNTFIEVVWTLLPVLILVAIAVPSIRLLANQFKPAPDNAVTLKAIGNQWFWSYEYPDHAVQLTANMLKEKSEVSPGTRFRTDADGPRLLAVDNRVVLPVGVPIRVLATAQDVIHAWAIPAFGAKIDAVPGKLNEINFTIEKPGIYYGQCSELCGARHAYMPIAVEAVSPEVFARWVAAKGGKMPSAVSAAAAPAAGASAGNDSADDTAATENGAGPVVNATEAPAAANEAAPANAAAEGH